MDRSQIMKLHITKTMYDEYEWREVYPFLVHGPGWYEVSFEQAYDMLDDARYMIDPELEIEHAPGMKQAYRAIIKQIEAKLGVKAFVNGRIPCQMDEDVLRCVQQALADAKGERT